MLIGTIDFYHIIPLSLILTFSGGHKGQRKANTCQLCFLADLSMIRIEFDMMLKLNLLKLLSNEVS